jgi:hypothetical protein
MYSRQFVHCIIYTPKLKRYADGRSICIPVIYLVEWNLIQSAKLLRLAVRSHVNAAPTMHESRHCIDP